MNHFLNGFNDELEKLGKFNSISRAMTSRYNPMMLGGLPRYIESRALAGRLLKGSLKRSDRRVLEKLLAAQHGTSREAVRGTVKKIMADAKAGKFRGFDERKFPISRLLGWNKYPAIAAPILGAEGAISGGMIGAMTPGVGHLAGAATGAGVGVGGAVGPLAIQMARRGVGSRGLAGRLAGGKKLMKSEQELMELLGRAQKHKG